MRVTASNASLVILNQTLNGNFAFEQSRDAGKDGVLGTADDEKVVKLAATGIVLNLGDGTTNFVSVTQGPTQSATFVITSAGFAGQISAGVTVNIPGETPVSAPSITVSINNTTAAVHEMRTGCGRTADSRLRRPVRSCGSRWTGCR